MGTTLTEAALTSVAARFADTSPSEFSGKVQDLFTVLGRIRDDIQKSVEEGLIPPTTGCGILACAGAQLFGYAEYTGIVNPSPLSAAMWNEHGNGKGTTG